MSAGLLTSPLREMPLEGRGQFGGLVAFEYGQGPVLHGLIEPELERYRKDFAYGFTGEFTLEEAEEHCRLNCDAMARGTNFAYWIAVNEAVPVIGLVSLSGPEYDPAKPWDLGYAVAESHEGRGFAYRAARTLISYATRQAGVREVTAQIRQDNPRSGRVAGLLGLRPDPGQDADSSRTWRATYA